MSASVDTARHPQLAVALIRHRVGLRVHDDFSSDGLTVRAAVQPTS
jgi:hypothetical protein